MLERVRLYETLDVRTYTLAIEVDVAAVGDVSCAVDRLIRTHHAHN